MNKEFQNIDIHLLLQSLEDDFDPKERERILEALKNSEPKEEALQGAKMLLEQNNWDYTQLKKAFAKTETRIDTLATTSQRATKINYLKYAAVLLPIAFALFYFINNSINHKQNLDQWYPKEEGLPNYMGTEKTNWDALMEPYRANKMKEAFVVSERILALKPQNDTAIYFHGVISYELKNFKLAKQEYAQINQHKKSVFYEDAKFRLGFALFHLQEKQAAKQVFEQIAKDATNPFREKAKEILQGFYEQ